MTTVLVDVSTTCYRNTEARRGVINIFMGESRSRIRTWRMDGFKKRKQEDDLEGRWKL